MTEEVKVKAICQSTGFLPTPKPMMISDVVRDVVRDAVGEMG